jgi:uncharacterized membrane protein
MTTISETPRTAATVGRRPANVALWVLQGLLAATYLAGAMPKLTTQPEAVAGFADIGFSSTGMFVIGVLEVAGAVALLIPRLCGLAALAFVGLMTGAVTVTALHLGAADTILPGTLLVLVTIVAWARRDRTVALAALVGRR